MPKRILIIGLLFVICGGLAIWSMIDAATQKRIHLNFAVLCLPVGIGLFRGKASSQWWARFWICIGYLGAAALIGVAIVNPRSAYVSWYERAVRGPDAVPYVIIFASMFAVVLFGFHQLLYSPKANAYFREK